MAIYKSTYCYPFLTSVDIRVSSQYDSTDGSVAIPVEYGKCKVETSNKNVTGFKLRLLDENNNQVFPIYSEDTKLISPIEELQNGNLKSIYKATGINSGINGTFLQFPFFQNWYNKDSYSFNTLYFKPRFKVDHVILNSSLAGIDLEYGTDIQRWIYSDTDGTLSYDWPDGGSVTVEDDQTKSTVKMDYTLYWYTEIDGSISVLYPSSTKEEKEYAYKYGKEYNRISVDGEMIENGEIIAVISNSDNDKNKVGFYYAYGKVVEYSTYEESGYQTILKPIETLNNIMTTEGISFVVAKGDNFHDTVWINNYNASTSKPKIFRSWSTDTDGEMWCAYARGADPDDKTTYQQIITRDVDLSLGGSLYKWEITLYQGDKVIYQVIDGSETETAWVDTDTPKYCLYSNVANKDYDMLVSSGTILGSTTERLQIAMDAPFTSEFENASAVLPGLKSGVLVLQSRYVALGAANSADNSLDIFNTARTYVQSYDSSYGHVYPISDGITQTMLDAAGYAQFFKYGNDENSIESSDIVEYGTSNYSNFKFVKLNSSEAKAYANDAEQTWIDEVSIVDRYIAIWYKNLTKQGDDWSGVWKYDGTTITEGIPPMIMSSLQKGDKILLTGESSKEKSSVANDGNYGYRNGVYTYGEVSQTYGSGDAQYTTTIGYLQRDASYDSWAEYIGKIIYCKNYVETTVTDGSINNSVNATNLKCLATAGLYTLWDPLNDALTGSSIGGTVLLFTLETPILLFESQIKDNRTYDFLYSYTEGAFATGSYFIDKANVVAGDIVLAVQSNKASVRQAYIVQKDKSWVAAPNLVPDNLDFCFINKGQIYGQRVIYLNDDTPNITWGLHTAMLLKNTPEYTFISPFVNVTAGMRLVFAKENTVTYYATATSLESHNYLDIKNVNSTLYCVLHADLKKISGETIEDATLTSAKSKDDNTPWTYKIMSYFKVSDENAFYAYANPYILIYKDGLEYTGLANTFFSQSLYVKKESGYGSWGFSVTQDISDSGSPFIHVVYREAAKVSSRFVKMSASYRQFEDADWESYRWVLTDADGNILQDTGKKYDKDIVAYFYGLADDQNIDSTMYYAILYLEDDISNVLTYKIPLEVFSNIKSGTTFNFTTQCIPELHAMKLSYDASEDYDQFSIYRREYGVYENPGLHIEGYYYNGEFYKDSEYQTKISPRTGIIYTDHDSGYYYIYDYKNKQYVLTPHARVYKGQWQPVITNTTKTELYDYNIQNGRSYQYILYPVNSDEQDWDRWGSYEVAQNFANGGSSYKVWAEDVYEEGQGKLTDGTDDDSETGVSRVGAPSKTHWDNWSIAELVPIDSSDEDLPVVDDIYTVDPDNVWLFKYSLEAGSQTQNISRSEFQTLGVYPKMGFGKSNYASGEVSALLGSEIIPYSKLRYVERVRGNRVNAITTNEKAYMLSQWQKLVASSNPKLLTDMKGNSWIVHIMSSSNTTKNNYINYPDTISFQWKQVESVHNVEIYGDLEDSADEIEEYGKSQWDSVF